MAEALVTLGLQLHPTRPGSSIWPVATQASISSAGTTARSPRASPGRYYLLHWPSSRAMNSIRERIRQLTPPRWRTWASLLLKSPKPCQVPEGLGPVPPDRQLGPAVPGDRRVRLQTYGDLHQREAQPFRPELGRPIQLRLVSAPGGPPPIRNDHLEQGACLTVNGVGKPCAGEPRTRFDGRGWKTEQPTPPRQPSTLLETEKLCHAPHVLVAEAFEPARPT